jgi:hypothetical protein
MAAAAATVTGDFFPSATIPTTHQLNRPLRRVDVVNNFVLNAVIY